MASALGESTGSWLGDQPDGGDAQVNQLSRLIRAGMPVDLGVASPELPHHLLPVRRSERSRGDGNVEIVLLSDEAHVDRPQRPHAAGRRCTGLEALATEALQVLKRVGQLRQVQRCQGRGAAEHLRVTDIGRE